MIVATAGHVDHGKSLLVKNLTGTDPDRWQEEKDRGLTIDLGFAYAHQQDPHGRSYSLGFIDVPGHIRFISNMLAGVSTIDKALLVVAADDGPMPQTEEHLAILKLLGISDVIAVITKVDRVDGERRFKVEQQTRNLLATYGYPSPPLFQISNITLSGMEDLQHALEQLAVQHQRQQDEQFFRLAIDRVFSVKGSGTVVTGSVFSGSVTVGNELTLLPQNLSVRVRGLHRQNQTSEHASAGDRCALNITGQLNNADIKRGNWLAQDPAPASRRIDAEIEVLSTAGQPLKHWTPVHLHTAANHVGARVATLEDRQIAPGQKGLVQLVLTDDINSWYGDRLILRDQSASQTLAGGMVVCPVSPGRGRARPERLATLKALQQSDTRSAIADLLLLSPAGLDLTIFAQQRNLSVDSCKQLAGQLDAQVLTSGSSILAVNNIRLEEISLQVKQSLEFWHKQHPDQQAMTLSALQRTLKPAPHAVVTATALQRLASEIVLSKQTVRLKSAATSLSKPLQQLWRELEPLMKKDPLRPPVVHDLAREMRRQPRALEQQLAELASHSLLVRPTKNRFYLPSAVAELQDHVVKLGSGGPFTAADYRDITGLGRNLAIELLEYFDRTGITYRTGDKRQLR